MADRWRHAAPCVALVLLLVGACGKKGPPLPPIRIVSQAPSPFTVRRLGGQVYLQFVVPMVNTDGSTPADLAVVEVYAVTLDPLPAGVSPLTDEELVEAGTLLALIDVRPPPPPAEPVDPDAPPPAPQEDPLADIPLHGATLSVREALAEDSRVPVDLAEIDRRFEPDDDDGDEVDGLAITGLRWVQPPGGVPFLTPPQRRTYVAVGRSTDGELGMMSERLTVRLDASPASPPVPNVSYTADAATIRWLPARGATRGVQDALVAPAPVPVDALTPVVAALPPLASTPTIPSAESTTYNVYASSPALGEAVEIDARPLPLNPTPLAAFELVDAEIEFGVERCYVIRTIALIEGDPVESEASLSTCVEFRDTFPPAPPGSLAAVGTVGAVSLIWGASPAEDLAGYLILRGEAPGDTLQPLMTEPLTETTYRDATGSPGVAYTYAVVAVDTAEPANVSEPSNRVTESPQ